MITLRRSADRGHRQNGWYESRYSFSFADYRDPANVRFSVLRVLNEDFFGPGTGFPEHPHRDVELFTYLRYGELEHRDSLGNRQTLHRGGVQRLTAGSGITHSELNLSDRDPAHLFQVWILPDRKGRTPAYEARHFSDEDKRDRLCLLASRDGRDGALRIHQNVAIYAAVLSAEQRLEYPIGAGRRLYLQLAEGELEVEGETLRSGDAIRVERQDSLAFTSRRDRTELLLFDLP